ncbi:DNA replication licensing factor mcm10 [Staphylotrichum tortipilum]|uniref:DNA replication licensing factor mcm10 n=1 Tax=Staphylotrichum tortipilum TaxID=2831512 RepID=A0AAN6MMU4_9PEZI|nr:DNA replication licensing factor mcm10 [Staphylotrichum longicolle]
MAAQWPPKSPHDVLLSTPKGREKLRRMAERTSPSPSPTRLRTSRSIPALSSRPGTRLSGEQDELFDGMDLDDDEEDEEMLQLKLQAIQAKLRLKKLQAAKAQRKAATPPGSGSGEGGGMREVPIQSRLAAVRDRLDRQADVVQVPASPVRKTQAPAEQTSPQRVLLGIDKGLRAADVSLKKAPSQRAGTESRQVQQGGWLRRSDSRLGGSQTQPEQPRPLSFNERLASARTEETTRQERREKAESQRSKAFSIGKEEMEGYKSKAQDLPDLPSKPQEFSRQEILASIGRGLPRSNTAPILGSGRDSQDLSTKTSTSATGTPESEGVFEPYSGLHLSKRILPHNVLARAVSGKKPYLIKDLLRLIKAPDWSLPDDEPDIVVFAIVASKSDPRSHRPGPGSDGKSQQDRGKYMVLTLVDLAFEVELFLFNSGFDRFWKLTPGTVLAILNPGILPPPPGREATNRFGLVINSDEDTILEIGNARDIGYCKSIKKDGSPCKSWVNARRTEYCEFHTNEAVRKARSARIEMSATAGFGGSDGQRGRTNARRGFNKSEDEVQRSHYDRATQSQYFISSAHRNTDPLDERITGIADRKEREEGLKRRLAQKEKERDIARRLGELGAGAGKDYMTRAASRATTTSTSTKPTKWDARALGLVGRRGADQPKINLGPPRANSAAGAAKRKRPESSSSSSSATVVPSAAARRAALGWGSGLKDKLGRMKEGERLDGRTINNNATEPPVVLNAVAEGGGGGGSGGGLRRGDKSPVRKKTRFVTEKGIREAGRESLGEPLSAAVKTRRQVVLDDDDDDLIILK